MDLLTEESRLATFKNWPFDENQICNARAMAEAGFYSCATGKDDSDAARCFFCQKELDGWDPNDNPWTEHLSHAPNCTFAKGSKPIAQLKVYEFLAITKELMKNELRVAAQGIKDALDERAEEILHSISKK